MTSSGYSSFISVNLETKDEADVTAKVLLQTGLALMNVENATDKEMEVGYQLINTWHDIKEAKTFKETNSTDN